MAHKQRIRRTLGLAIALNVSAFASVGAQGLGTFAGTIFDDLSGRPLRRAEVSIRALDLRVATGANGQFVLEGVPPGRHEVKFEADGYVSVVETLDIAPSDFLQIRLDPVAAVLDQILVLAGRAPAARLGAAVVEAPEGDGSWLSALDLLEEVPGLEVRRGGGLANGAAIFVRGVNSFRSDGAPVIVIDGVRVETTQTGYNSIHALEMIPAEAVSRVRVLKGAAETGFYAMGANGVILIDTQRGVGPRD